MPLRLSEHASAAAVVIAFAVWLRAQRRAAALREQDV